MVLRLPPVDQYRIDFIIPLGHLAMQAAHADNELVSLCARVPFEGSPGQISGELAAHKLRNWSPDAEKFVTDRIGIIVDPYQRDRAFDAVARYALLRGKRHRAIHDAVEVSLREVGGLYVVESVAVEYRRKGNDTEFRLNRVTPEQIAELACAFYEVQQDFKSIAT